MLSRPGKKTVSAKDISDETYIVQEDVIATLKEMGVLEKKKSGSAEAVVNKANVRNWMQTNGVSFKPPVNVEGFILAELGVEEEEEDG